MSPTDIIAIIAIVVSIGSLVVQLIIDSRRNRKNHIRELYDQAYKDILMKDLPTAVATISWANNRVNSTYEFGEVCRRLRFRSGFFRFYDEKFHGEIVEEIMKVEDYALDMDNHQYKRSEYDRHMAELNKMIKSLYNLIMDRCL